MKFPSKPVPTPEYTTTPEPMSTGAGMVPKAQDIPQLKTEQPSKSNRPFNTPLSNAKFIPSNWVIETSSKGIYAKNNVTHDVYEGTQADFNKILNQKD